MNIIRDIWKDFQKGQNLDIYITVIIAIVVSILGIFQVADISVITSAVLATLALVSISLLMNRRDNDEIQKAILKIETKGTLAENFLTSDNDIPQITQLIQKAQKIYFLGTSLSTSIQTIKYEIEKGLQRGLEVKFLLMKPYGTAIAQAVVRSKDHDENYFNEMVEISLYILETIAKNVPNGKLEYRVIDFLPHYSILAIDPHLSTGHIFIRMPVFKSSSRTRPRFKLSCKDDKVWSSFFLEQFEKMWKVSDSYESKIEKGKSKTG